MHIWTFFIFPKPVSTTAVIIILLSYTFLLPGEMKIMMTDEKRQGAADDCTVDEYGKPQARSAFNGAYGNQSYDKSPHITHGTCTKVSNPPVITYIDTRAMRHKRYKRHCGDCCQQPIGRFEEIDDTKNFY